MHLTAGIRTRTRTMKNISILFSLWLTPYCFADEDCKPRSQFEIPGTSTSSHEFQAYTKEYPLTLHVTFQNLNQYLISDRIVLSNESTVYQLRDGNIRSTPLHIVLPMDGWQTFTLSINGSSLYINNFTKILDYPIETMIVIGNNLTLCSDGTPMWHIDDRQQAIIPILNSKSSGIQLKLFSHTEFETYIGITKQQDSYNYKIVKRSANNAVTMSKNQDYMMIISDDKIFIKDMDGVIVMSRHLLERPSELSVSSRKGEFNITLLLNHPYQESKQDFQTPATQNENRSRLYIATHNSPSTGFIVMAVTAALSLTFCMVVFIVVLRNKRCRHNDQNHNTVTKELSKEEVESVDTHAKKYIHVSYQPI